MHNGDYGRPRIGSLCSGYGGLDMAAEELTGGTTAWHVEHNPDASRILAHHWPTVPNHHDVKGTDWTRVEPVDVLTAGYPCQPFSHAGRRGGETDPRHLWPDVAQAVRVLRPRLVLLENVAGHLSLGFGRVLGDLAEAGYDTSWVCIRAADVGAPHGRARVFIAATDTDRERSDGRGLHRPAERRGSQLADGDLAAPDADVKGLEGDGASGRSAQRPQPVRHQDASPDAAGDGRDEGRSEPARLLRGPHAPVSSDAPTDPGGERLAQQPRSTPAEEARAGAGDQPASDRGPRPDLEWGPYHPAIRQWERLTGRGAPRPTEPGRTGRERLSPAFVEWMMGLPAGHVTDPAIGISRNAQLTALGNGVVPQQAVAGYRLALTQFATEQAA